MTSSLHLFHPVTGTWFAERYGEPTDVQRLAEPPSQPADLSEEGRATALQATLEPLGRVRRSESTHLVFHGGRPVIVSTGRGRSLDLRVAPEDPRMSRYLRFLEILVGRESAPLKTVTVETIAGTPAPTSPYRPALERLFLVDADDRALRLYRRH